MAEGRDVAAVIEDIERTVAQERDALVNGNWTVLSQCTEHKYQLAEQLEAYLSTANHGDIRKYCSKLTSLKENTERNAVIAHRLSDSIAQLLGRAPSTTYTARGSALRPAVGHLHIRG